jgi:2-hydroxy-3-keto-5-methylthiopentenyl-1-phosphate phosphatase
VLVGDGASDYKAALLADIVFAKGTLAAWCARNGIVHIPFTTLRDVLDALVPRARSVS